MTKSGIGALTLSGAVDLQQGAIVNGGTLLISGGSAHTLTNLSGANPNNAVTVASGGSFGGNSTLTISGGDSVVVKEGGSLIAGDGIGSVGLLTLSGGNLDLSGVSTSTKWLHFDLGAHTTAGTTFDQIKLTVGNLALGSGLLEFDDFDFNAIGGFGVGDYRLFDASAHTGTLGSLLSGAIGVGYTGTLSLDGSNVLLTVDVIPEPQSIVLILFGMIGAFGLSRRRRSSANLS